MKRTVPPSAEIEEQIDQMRAVGVGENPRESLSELAKLGARLIIQRAVEDEFDAWLGRARCERRADRPEYQRGLRNGFRPRKLQTMAVSRPLTHAQSLFSASARAGTAHFSLVTMRAHRPVGPEVPGEPTATLPQVTLLVKRDEARRLIGVLDLPSAVHCAAQPRR